MSQLQPAGFFSGIASYFIPKEIVGQVRSESLPNGNIQIIPYFTVDGHEVPLDMVTVDTQQTILGYSVVLSKYAKMIHTRLQGKPQTWAKSKAAKFLKELQDAGIDSRSKDGRVQPRIKSVKPDVRLELGVGDILRVESELQTSEGEIVHKPARLAQLIKDEGWYTAGDDLVEVKLTNTPLDEKLFVEGGNGQVRGDEVPQLIESLNDNRSKIGDIEKNEPLQELDVFAAEPINRASETI